MEVYFDNLTSDKVSVNKLVEDVSSLVRDAEELVQSTGDSVAASTKEKLEHTLERVRSRSERIREQAVASARATDKIIRLHPYQSLGVAFGAALLVGFLCGRISNRDS